MSTFFTPKTADLQFAIAMSSSLCPEYKHKFCELCPESDFLCSKMEIERPINDAFGKKEGSRFLMLHEMHFNKGYPALAGTILTPSPSNDKPPICPMLQPPSHLSRPLPVHRQPDPAVHGQQLHPEVVPAGGAGGRLSRGGRRSHRDCGVSFTLLIAFEDELESRRR